MFLRPLDSLLSFTEAKENVLGSVRDLTWFGIIPLYYLVDDPKEKKVITTANSVLLLVKCPRHAKRKLWDGRLELLTILRPHRVVSLHRSH